MPSPHSLHGKPSAFHPHTLPDKRAARNRQHTCFALLLLGLSVLAFVSFKVHLGSHRSVGKARRPAPCKCTNVDDALRSVFSKSTLESSTVVKREPFFSRDELPDEDAETRRKVVGFVGVQTTFDSVELRKAIRRSWLASDPESLLRLEQATGLAFRFVLGKSNDSQKMEDLRKEMNIYNDFLRIDYEEENISSARKTLAFLKAAFHIFDADFYVKADENIYLRPGLHCVGTWKLCFSTVWCIILNYSEILEMFPDACASDRLATLLAKERTATRIYIGCMKNGPVIKNPRLNWYEPLGYILGNEYFYHAYGSIYALSTAVVEMLLSARNDSFRFFANEDITIGSWMLAMNVNFEDNQYLCDKACTPKSIAVVDLPKCSGSCNATSAKIGQLHKKGSCSKSPTLPVVSDDDIIV